LQTLLQKKLLNPLLDKLNLFKFPDLALRLSCPEDRLKQIHEHRDYKINSFLLKVPTESGIVKERDIHAPIGEYKFLLKRINNIILNRINLLQGVCGAVIGKNLFDMVRVHCGHEAILKIDLENFYQNISGQRIYSTLKGMNCSSDIAQYLMDLMTYNNSLPQGFSTSSMLANIVCYKLDMEQLKICDFYDINRTRWIDDIVFSGRRMDLEKAAPKLRTAVKKNGFPINEEKSSFSGRRDKVQVVGLLVNKKKPYISENIVQKVLSYIHIAQTEGYEKLRAAYPEEFVKKDVKKSLTGKVNHIQRFNKNQFQQLESELNKLP